MTNYEKIKAMSESELAEFLSSVGADVLDSLPRPTSDLSTDLTRIWLGLEAK